MSRTKPKATLTARPIEGHPGGMTITADCKHGTSTAIIIPAPGTPAPSPHGWTVLVLANLTLSEGCACCAALWARYAPIFAKEQGIACPPFRDVRRYGAAVAALVFAGAGDGGDA
jgi:hypothetical protein